MGGESARPVALPYFHGAAKEPFAAGFSGIEVSSMVSATLERLAPGSFPRRFGISCDGTSKICDKAELFGGKAAGLIASRGRGILALDRDRAFPLEGDPTTGNSEAAGGSLARCIPTMMTTSPRSWKEEGDV